MRLPYVLREPTALVALSASYLRGHLAQEVAGPRRWMRTAHHAARSVATAWEIGVHVRRAPVLRPHPGLLVSPRELTPVCSLVSDTHVTAPGHTPCELDLKPEQWSWGAPPTSDELAAGLGRVLCAIERDAPHTLIWCGDEVDTGSAAEWRRWHEITRLAPRLAHRLVPGNHDICFNPPFDEDHGLRQRAARELAYEAAAGPLAKFPLVDRIIGDAGPVTIILLDSCRHRSTHVLSNAVGRFGDDQLAALARILETTTGRVLCVTHHHVWRDARFLHPEAWYNTVVDADRFLDLLVAYRRRDRRHQVLVCHGHRHALTPGMIGPTDAPIAVVGLPSTTLGDKAMTDTLDGLARYAIAGLRDDGSWGVSLRTVGPLIARRDRPARPVPRTLRTFAVAARERRSARTRDLPR